MISSMTGFGRGEATEKGKTATAEVRSVNSRFLEISSRLPRSMTLRESEVKEIVRVKCARGKINVALNVTHENADEVPLKVNPTSVKAYYRLLKDIKKTFKIQDKITLEHLLHFPDIIEVNEFEKGDEKDWQLLKKALTVALDEVARMRRHEGNELGKDLVKRIHFINSKIDEIELIAKNRMPEANLRFKERVKELASDPSIVNEQRLELEFALLVDKLDVTEECVRFRSHNKYFIKILEEEEGAGRKLNFLIQEMNREANTIGSKVNSADIAHLVVAVKEELEKIREQLQNIE